MTIHYRILGPLEVVADGRVVPISSNRQRALLAALLVDANRVVTIRDLVRRVWGEATPAGARETLHSYVMRLRRILGQTGGTPVVTCPDGYLIEVADGALDLDRFTSLVAQGKAAGDPETAARLLRTAGGLWRGDALADVPSDVLRHEVVPALSERRLDATEAAVDATLRSGRHSDVVAELADLTTKHPLRERFWAQRMLAIYRCGRPAEALHCYDTVRKLLAEELGVDPGPELRALHRSVLVNDPTLAVPPPRTGRNDLPGDIPDFAGRAEQLRRLVDLVPANGGPGAVIISAIDGMAGIGKTTLAVHAAHQLAHRFPDGQLFIDLRGHAEGHEPTDPAAALDTLLRALDVPAGRIPGDLAERAALWRAELAGRRVLVVLDNAGSSGQVRPLLPGAANCLALITSRHRLADLDTADTLSLDVLSPDEALALFAGVVGTDRAQADPEATAEVLRLCGYLPLAIRIAAARLRTRAAWPVRALADRLADESQRSAELTVGDRSVGAALALSCRRMDDRYRELFSLLGRHPGVSFDSYQVAALGGVELSDAQRMLDGFVDMHLLQEPTPGRYRLHDLVRLYARTALVVAEPVCHAAIGRLLDHYLYLARRTDAYLNPDTGLTPADLVPPGPVPAIADADQAIQWCETELANLLAAINHAAESGRRTHAAQLAYALSWFFKRRGRATDWVASLQVGADAAIDDLDRANLLRALSNAYIHVGRFTDTTMDLLVEAPTLYRRIGDPWGEGASLNNMGGLQLRLGRIADAVDYYQQALAVRRRCGDVRGAAVILSNLCSTYEMLGRFPESLDCGQQALDAYRQVGDRRGEGIALNNTAVVLLALGRPAEALAHGQQALAVDTELRDRRNVPGAMDTIGVIHRHLGNYATAIDHHQRALALIREVGDDVIEAEIRENLADTLRAAAEAGEPAARQRTPEG